MHRKPYRARKTEISDCALNTVTSDCARKTEISDTLESANEKKKSRFARTVKAQNFITFSASLVLHPHSRPHTRFSQNHPKITTRPAMEKFVKKSRFARTAKAQNCITFGASLVLHLHSRPRTRFSQRHPKITTHPAIKNS